MAKAFVIHLHTGHGPRHYDLMLERGDGLATWQLGGDPAALAAGESMPAARLPDHRRAYLTYEGPVSRGRGQVERIDRGTCELIRADEAHWDIRLEGQRCRGRFELVAGDDPSEPWTLTRREPDQMVSHDSDAYR